ncbi:MAG: YqiA/YcfP family alpha/beta fold hydrolase [Anaerolineae bacterium]
MTTVMYLHGFASSPGGVKATFIRERCAERGIAFRAPDLNVPDFEQMTITAGIQAAAQAVAACPPGPVYLIGSSLGGLTALHLLEQHPARVEKLLLLAPGLGLARRSAQTTPLGPVDQWREQGYLMAYNYAREAEAAIHYGFLQDAMQYDGFSVQPPVPAHIVHGRHDETVPVEDSLGYAQRHPGVTVDVLDADHGLTARVATIWAVAVEFFGL